MADEKSNALTAIKNALDLVEAHLRQWPDHDDIDLLKKQITALKLEIGEAWPANDTAVEMANWLAFYAVRELEDRLPEIAKALMEIPEPILRGRGEYEEEATNEQSFNNYDEAFEALFQVTQKLNARGAKTLLKELREALAPNEGGSNLESIMIQSVRLKQFLDRNADKLTPEERATVLAAQHTIERV